MLPRPHPSVMNMLPPGTAQSYGWGPPSSTRPPRAPGGVRHQLVIGLALLTVGLLAGLTRTSRGLLAIGLAWVVVGFLGQHRDDGGRRQWFKALAEYATVAALAVAVLTAGPTPTERPTKPRPPAAKTKTSQGDPLEGIRARVAEWRERLPRVEVTTNKEGR